jgi:hypothetical protein
MKALVALAIARSPASGIALAAPANGWTPWGGGTNCFLANVNDLEGQQPYVAP